METNTQTKQNVLSSEEQLLDTQMKNIYKRAKGKWSWISILATIADVFVALYAVIVFIFLYRLVGSIDDALWLTLSRAWFMFIVFGVGSILSALSKHLTIGECANLLKSEKVDYRAWLKAGNKQMDATNQSKNMDLIDKHEQLFYAIQRLETSVGNVDLIKRAIPSLIADVVTGIVLYVYMISVSISSVIVLVVLLIVIFGIGFLETSIKNSQRRTMLDWVKMTVLKLENEASKGVQV